MDPSVVARLGMSDQDRALFASRRDLVQAPLAAAREGRFADAREAIARLTALDETSELTVGARLMAKSATAAGAAYVDYREGKFENALARLIDAFATTNELMAVFHADQLEARRVHLGTNWIRVVRARGEAERAARMGFALLAYAEGDVRCWPIPEVPVIPRGVDLETAPQLINVLVGEIAAAAGADLSKTWFTAACAEREATRRSSAIALRRAHLWLHLKQLYFAGREHEFIAAAASFIEEGWYDARALWEATFVDAWRTTGRHPSPAAARARDALAVDRATRTFAPPFDALMPR